MSKKLGEINKPQVSDFFNVRRLFCLPLIPQIKDKDLDKELKNLIEMFWNQSTKQIMDLEKTGKVSKIFFESLTKDGKAGSDLIKQISIQSYTIVKEKMDKGATIVIIEDEKILNEFIDWSICLSVIRKSTLVLTKVLEFQKEASQKRNKKIAEKIDSGLKSNESGLLIMTDENRLEVQSHLPSDIQVFLIHPPALNDFNRSFRDYLMKQKSN